MGATTDGIARRNSMEFFVEQYRAQAREFPETVPAASSSRQPNVTRAQVLEGLESRDGAMMARVNRRFVARYHPDERRNVERLSTDPSYKRSLDAIRNKYESGRSKYMALTASGYHEGLVAANRDARQAAQLSTRFHYDLKNRIGRQIPYRREMGDIFHHAGNDLAVKHPYRQVPRELGDPNTAPGFTHRHFREYGIVDAPVRATLIDLFLRASPEQRRQLDLVRQHAEAASLDPQGPPKDAAALIAACRGLERQAYLRGQGLMEEIPDPAVRRRVGEFLSAAPLAQVHSLKNHIVRACETNPGRPMADIVRAAHRALVFDNIVTNNHLTDSRVTKDEVFAATFEEKDGRIVSRRGRVPPSSRAYGNTFERATETAHFEKDRTEFPEYATGSYITENGLGYMLERGGNRLQGIDPKHVYVLEGKRDGESFYRLERRSEDFSVAESYFANR